MLEIAFALKTFNNTLAGDQVFPSILPPGATLPACAYWTVSDVPFQDQQGHAGTSLARVQVSCWTNTNKEAKQFLEEIADLWEGFSGSIALSSRSAPGWFFSLFPPWTGSQTSLEVVSCWLEGQEIQTEGIGWGSPETVWHASTDLGILYRQP